MCFKIFLKKKICFQLWIIKARCPYYIHSMGYLLCCHLGNTRVWKKLEAIVPLWVKTPSLHRKPNYRELVFPKDNPLKHSDIWEKYFTLYTYCIIQVPNTDSLKSKTNFEGNALLSSLSPWDMMCLNHQWPPILVRGWLVGGSWYWSTFLFWEKLTYQKYWAQKFLFFFSSPRGPTRGNDVDWCFVLLL